MTHSVELRSVGLEHPVMNAAGMDKTIDQVAASVACSSSATVWGSLTGQDRLGNDEPRYFFNRNRQYSINAMGLPDPGPAYYIDRGERDANYLAWAEHFLAARAKNKPIVLSIAPLGDFASSLEVLIRIARYWKVDVIELNLGCPNVWGLDGVQKRIASFDTNGMMMQIERVAELWAGPIWLKLSPYSDPVQLQDTAQHLMFLEEDIRDRIVVVTSNTFPNGMVMNDRVVPLLSVQFGGFAGPAFKPIALGQVAQWANVLEGTGIPIIGVGGINSGIDVADYLAAGATAVQIGTHYYEHGPRIFTEVVDEWVNL